MSRDRHTGWTDEEAFDLARRLCVAHGGDPEAPIYQGHGQVGENWQVYLPMASEALIVLSAKFRQSDSLTSLAPELLAHLKLLVALVTDAWPPLEDTPPMKEAASLIALAEGRTPAST